MQTHKLSILIAALIAISHYKDVAALTCSTGSGTSQACTDALAECFVKTDNGVVTRGCTTDPACAAPNCLKCKTDNCNAALMCKQCDATQSDCGRTTGANSSNVICGSPTQQCGTQLQSNGAVVRGCLNCAANDSNCKSCATDNCNVGIFPENRQLCYQCSGESCSNLDNSTMLLGCAIYQATGQKCYTIGTSATNMQRGCQSDTAADNKCSATSTDPSCLFCDNENGCNNRPYSRVLGSCYKCNDSDKCQLQQEASTATECAAAVYTQNVNSCYTQLLANGVVARGCTNELAAGCNASNNCDACEGNNCNAAVAVFKCLICRSDYYAPCREAEVGQENCPASSLTGPDAMKCFSGEWDGVVIRGCLSEASDVMKYQCSKDSPSRCTECSGMGCNDISYNVAATLQQMALSLFALICIVHKYI
ncbi:PREDICTED: uncharacterized protein LOC108611448 [Drosophila arizonae]|uniref:Uncharacterized protein LOC108611448 n=1 Tax=Drosophila arizonae TaxID=7263 RepID=A0ABM1NXB7_DROAR|nr:PREDICTED: uncharacterized protein LOC108611448 [Drosophila arizonae]